jgi:hypothetical protein
MKRFLCVLAVAVLALTSCEGFELEDLLGGGDKTETPSDYDIVISPSLLQFAAEGGAKEIEKPQIDKLLDLRQNYYKVPGRHPGYKKYND